MNVAEALPAVPSQPAPAPNSPLLIGQTPGQAVAGQPAAVNFIDVLLQGLAKATPPPAIPPQKKTIAKETSTDATLQAMAAVIVVAQGVPPPSVNLVQADPQTGLKDLKAGGVPEPHPQVPSGPAFPPPAKNSAPVEVATAPQGNPGTTTAAEGFRRFAASTSDAPGEPGLTQVPKTAPPRNQGLPPAEGPTTTGVPTAADFKVGASPLPSLPAPAHVHSDPDNGADQAASVASAATISRVPGAETAKAVEKAAPPSSLTDQIQDSFRAHLDQLREAGRVEVQMDLHPPELGRVQMSIALHDGRIDVRFVVQNEAARSALDHQVEPLRVRFAEMGLSLSQFDVRRDGTSNQEPPAQPEVPAQVAQLATKEPARTRKAYDPVANSASVVDVMA